MLLTVISVEMRKVNSDEETPNVIWPQQHILDSAGLFNTTGSSASVRIPSSFMRKAGMASGKRNVSAKLQSVH